MKDYTLIENTWEGVLMRHAEAYTSLEAINMSEENKHLLEYIGLPAILSDESEKLLPFSFFPSVTIQDKEFYLLGDIGSVTTGIVFLGLDKASEEIYKIRLRNEGKSTYSFMNQSLYQYLMCLVHYTNFGSSDYPEISPESKDQVRADYQQLKDNLTSIDPKAMAELSDFWANLVYGIQVGGLGDYFCDIDYDTYEPTFTPEEQEAMDKDGLPF